MKRLGLFISITASLFALFGYPQSSSAISGNDFDPGRIIDDSIFFNGNSISPGDIQAFLNSKVPVCDTNHPSSNPSYQPPFTCLKDFRQDTPSKAAETGLCNSYTGGNRSAAEIIYEVGVSCGISQKALIVLLEKEQSLVTDTWPWSIQYRSATGYGCPDTAPCDAEYYGFFNQVYNAARQFKRYARDESSFRYRAYRSNYIQYNPDASCGGTNVFIQNQATAGLYNYTPYQPNSYALNGGNQSGYPYCGAFGNRNFWRLYNDWFGPPTNSDNYWNLVKHPTDGRYFIATNFAVHYIPDGQTLTDWGLASLQPITVTTEFITSRTYGSPLNRLLRDRFGNIFLMDGGKRHYVRDSKYLQLWRQDINSAITVHGLTTYVPDGEWLGHCGKSLATPTNVWVMNAVNKYLASAPLQSAWGCNNLNTTSLSDNFLASYPSGGNASYFAINGSTPFVINQSLLWSNSDTSVVGHYKPANENYLYLDSRLKQLFNLRTLTLFSKDSSTEEWFYIENATKHYISSSKLANLWGLSENGGLGTLSTDFLSALTTGVELSPLARTTTPNRYYILDATKRHYLPDQTSIDEWSKPGTNIVVMPNNVLDRYSEGDAIHKAVGKNVSGAFFLAQEGRRLELWHQNLVDSWGASSGVNINNALYAYLESGGAAWFTAREGANYYYLENGVRHFIPATLDKSWGLSNSVNVLPQTLSRYNLSSTTLRPYISIGGRVYSLLNFTKTALPQPLTNIIPTSQITTLQKDYFPKNQTGTYLLRSSDGADARLWLSGADGKILLNTTAQALNLGYISKSIELTLLSPESINAIPDSPGVASLLIQSPTGALKLLSFGVALSLPDSQTAQAYISITGSVSPVSQQIFDFFPVNRTATRLIRDDSGKVFWVENGTKRWIVNGAHLSTTFANIPQTYLHSSVISLIPNGATIN